MRHQILEKRLDAGRMRNSIHDAASVFGTELLAGRRALVSVHIERL